eukprot:scaffold308673_cov30-Tisochrysis_lutea.AAC.2
MPLLQRWRTLGKRLRFGLVCSQLYWREPWCLRLHCATNLCIQGLSVPEADCSKVRVADARDGRLNGHGYRVSHSWTMALGVSSNPATL